MAAAATSFSPSSISTTCSSTKALKPDSKTLAFPLGFLSSSASRTALNSLKTRASGFGSGHGSGLAARMVSAPAINAPVILDFETSVFKKEKISLAGHEEVIN